jgi:hypothetical protein
LPNAGNDALYKRTQERKDAVLSMIATGKNVHEALEDARVGVSYNAYRQWRARDPRWGAAVDVARAAHERPLQKTKLSSAAFAMRYFNRVRAPFQQQWIDKVESMRPGNILLSLWPPEHGKTTTFEDYATERLCRDPNWRNTTASESANISKRIVGRVRKRFEVDGPFPRLVKEWGPFRPDAGRGQGSAFYQPWNDAYFNVMRKRTSDERDYNMLAIGWDSSTVSIRTDHLHIDDLQSLKTLSQTKPMLEWFRQDALSRPGESGKTTLSGTRVDDGDFWSEIEDDAELDGILEVLKFPAIRFNALTGEQEPLWPEKNTLEGLDRIRRKIKDEAFDRNYMMAPGISRTKRTFSDAGKALALNPQRHLNQFQRGDEDLTFFLSLDPGLDPGKCTLNAWSVTAERMRLAYFEESDKLLRNEEIDAMVERCCRALEPHGKIAVLVVEAMNFQRGLARDEGLKRLKLKYGFIIQEHLTNINKYDENIGIASMAGDWEAGKIELPYADDRYTRAEIDEMCRQLKAWKPLVRGSKLRQDRVVTMWFAWIWWQQKRRSLDRAPQKWVRHGVPWRQSAKPSLIIPIGVTL